MQGGSRGEEGWTLVELIVVLGVIAMLFVLALPSLLGVRRSAFDMEAKMRLTSAVRAEAALAPELGEFTDDPTWLEAAMPEFDLSGTTAGSVHVVLGETEPGEGGGISRRRAPFRQAIFQGARRRDVRPRRTWR